MHLLTGSPNEALVDARQSSQMARQLEGGANQGKTLILLGRVHEELHQWTDAARAYQDALTTYLTLRHLHQTVEPRAGLARLTLATGNLAAAMAEVEEMLPILHDYPLAGFDEPFQVYLTCYTVLAAIHDSRAVPVLHTAHTLLTTYTERIEETHLRRSFLENVATHRALQEAYAHLQL